MIHYDDIKMRPILESILNSYNGTERIDEVFLDGKCHPETHINNKPSVVTNEINFIGNMAHGNLIGVVGNPIGWNEHEAQYKSLGFDINNIVICEMNTQ